MELNINTDAVVRHTARLEQLHRSALPVAIRGALNGAAYDVKKVTMPKASDIFTHRSPTFFKATSKVNPAKGFNIRSMASMVGFLPQAGAKESGGATKDLQQQEDGGRIGHRAFIPLRKARAGSSNNRRVRANVRLAAIRSKIIDSKTSKAKTKAGQFFSSAMLAGKGGFVIGNLRNSAGNKTLLQINSVHRENGRTYVNSTPIYSVKSGRSVQPKATHFMRKASLISAGKMEIYYIAEAEKQIARLK
jgi:uncharacterized protein YfiM (DUF2279 family)